MDQAGWVTIALLGRVWGNRGELSAEALTSRPERFEQLREVYLFGVSEGRFPVESVWPHLGAWIFKFRGIDSIGDAEAWRGAEVRVPLSERVQLDAGEYFHSDLIGCEVRDRRSGSVIGMVTDVKEGGGPGLLEIDGSLLVPFASAICVSIDPGARRIEVDLPEGLLDLNRP